MFMDILGKIVSILTNLPDEMSGGLLDLVEKLASKNGKVWYDELMKFLRREPCWAIGRNPYLRKIADGTLRPTDGKRTIAGAKKMFPGGLDGDYSRWGTDVPGKPSLEMPFEVYELVKDGKFAQIFDAFGAPLDSLCWEQDKILTFVEDHPELLHPEGYGTFFLFKVKFDENTKNEREEFFVADVYRNDDGLLRAYVHRLSYGNVWIAEYRYRFVVPQLA